VHMRFAFDLIAEVDDRISERARASSNHGSLPRSEPLLTMHSYHEGR